MIIYLAARYSRRMELCSYRTQLADHGIAVTARWLDGSHQLGNDGMPLTETGWLTGVRHYETWPAFLDALTTAGGAA